MIVMNKEDAMGHDEVKKHTGSLEDMFRKEIDAYCSYHEWFEDTEDPILEMALEEIMMDEFLHAKFLRDYMLDKNMFKLTEEDPHEKKFWKIKRKLFHE